MSKAEQLDVVEDEEGLNRLLEFIHRARGFDFTGYKKTSLKRRLGKRMQEAGVDTYGDYQDYLEANPHEFAELFNTILINVTSFFRDRAAWTYLAESVIPQLLEGDGLIRAWCAGCATGEEAYTTAMVLAEALGEQAFRQRVKIYATDVDENALNHARHAVYSRDSAKNVPPELLEKYFEPTPQGYAFRTDLRRSVIFGRNDLVQDAPISRVDLLVSRNALMYFTADAQSRILERFNFALSERGFLFLGKSEMLITHTDLFTPYDLKWRVFKKVPRHQLRDRLAFIGGDGEIAPPRDPERYGELRTGAFALALTPQILVSRTGFVVDINQQARELLELKPSDVGRPFQDLAVSYRPADLRSTIEQAYETNELVTIGRIAWPVEGDGRRYFEIQVRVVPGTNSMPLGVAISFHDITALASLADEHEERKRELETAYEELQSTVEELETTNEELQSTNEELETTNEELQSTNEELETMNEELQSTNDELETMNNEQVERSSELDRVNMFLEGILTSLGVGVIVLDSSRHVQVWNGESTELWGLRPEEVEGRRLDELDIGLPVKKVLKLLDVAMGSEHEAAGDEFEAVNRRGRAFRCSVRALPLITPSNGVSGALVLMADAGDGGLPRELHAG
jgi:two-component system, chemotaxis family, CheB/CheR fusion protein